jgi:hypothetical protein
MDGRFDTLRDIINEQTDISITFSENEKRKEELRKDLIHEYGYEIVEQELKNG